MFVYLQWVSRSVLRRETPLGSAQVVFILKGRQIFRAGHICAAVSFGACTRFPQVRRRTAAQRRQRGASDGVRKSGDDRESGQNKTRANFLKQTHKINTT